ncbi:MAG TPA: hypothetical protein VF331_14155 [Polyangiales bacterium]
MHGNTLRQSWLWSATVVAGLVAGLAIPQKAAAIPSFARKYQTSCTTCHTVYPMLNSFGEAFRRNGYRFPSQNGSTDGDATLAPSLPLGQSEYAKQFPDAVWPDKIMQAVPLSVWVNGGVSVNLPKSDAEQAAGNNFTWNNILSEMHLFGAGAFDDRVTYFTQLTFASDGLDLETAYLLWNDVLGADQHALNLWVGRLMAPSLTSFGGHSSYLSDMATPAVSLAGLFNPNGSFVLGQGHSDGVEANGVLAHRVGWSVGWLASMPSTGLKIPNAEDLYAHLGVKLGGMSLDGEGPGGALVANAKRPWEETSLTLDAFGYHGMNVLDNGTASTPVGQRSAIDAVGGGLRLNVGSLIVNAGLQFEQHSHPYQGTPAMGTTAAAPDRRSGNGYTQFNEVDYVVFPWFVPGVRTELTHLGESSNVPGTAASLLRILPGIAFLVRQNIKVVVVGDLEMAQNLPPAGGWDPAGGLSAPTNAKSSFVAEQVNVNAAWAF